MSKEMIKKMINEVLGVPENLTKTARIVYDEVYNAIPDDIDFDDIDGFNKTIYGDFEIADYKFNEINFSMDIREHSDFELIGMSTGEQSKITKKFKLKSQVKNKFEITFRFIGPKETTGADIKNLMKSKRAEFIGSIGHELKHRYDFSKIRKSPLASRVKYQSTSGRGFGDITPINKFIHFMYYAHIVESLVRPSELASIIDDGQITKKEFYNFITSTRTYKTLTELKNFNYDTFKTEVKEEIPKIKQLFDYNDVDYDGLSDDQIVEKTLELAFKNIISWQGQNMVSFLSQHPLEAIFGFRGEKQIFFDNFIKHLERFGDNYEKFYIYEIKLFNQVGEKMIRKIIKLYDLSK